MHDEASRSRLRIPLAVHGDMPRVGADVTGRHTNQSQRRCDHSRDQPHAGPIACGSGMVAETDLAVAHAMETGRRAGRRTPAARTTAEMFPSAGSQEASRMKETDVIGTTGILYWTFGTMIVTRGSHGLRPNVEAAVRVAILAKGGVPD